MNKKLEAHQEVAVDFLCRNPHALLADQPGLGKTLDVIAAATRLGLRRNLVVCPASVRSGWRTEILECQADFKYTGALWHIISYNEAVTWKRDMAQLAGDFDSITLDESHFLKTPESQRTQAIFGNNGGLARRARYKWALTGTPVLNRPRELWPMLATLSPNFKDMNFMRFAQRYCGAFFDGRGINTKGASHLDELAGLLRGFMLRRTKREVYPNRKAPIVSKVPLELNAEEMASVMAEEDAIGARPVRISSRHDDFSQLGDTSRLLRLLGEAKLPKISAFVEDQLETVDKVVVFYHHTEVARRLYERFYSRGYKPVLYGGGMSDKAKDDARASFMKDPECRVFLGQRQAAGTGINGLQRVCSTAVIAEPSWVPGETEQMIDRLDRIGQEDDIVTAYILYAKGTLDAVVVAVHDRKEQVVERVLRDDPLGLGGLGL